MSVFIYSGYQCWKIMTVFVMVLQVVLSTTVSAQGVDVDELIVQLESTREYATKGIRQEGTIDRFNVTAGVESEEHTKFIYECNEDGLVKIWHDNQNRIKRGIQVSTDGVVQELYTPDYAVHYIEKLSGLSIYPIEDTKPNPLLRRYRDVGFAYQYIGDLKEHLKEVEEITIDEDSVIRLVTSRVTDNGKNKTVILNIMPEQGYRLKSEYTFFDGRLINAIRYEQYEKISTGHWFPKVIHKSYFTMRNNNPAIESIYSNAEWGALDDFDLRSIVSKNSNYEQVNFSSVQYFDVASVTEFDFQIVAGTRIFDYRTSPQKVGTIDEDLLASEVVIKAVSFAYLEFPTLLSKAKPLLFFTFIMLFVMLAVSVGLKQFRKEKAEH